MPPSFVRQDLSSISSSHDRLLPPLSCLQDKQQLKPSPTVDVITAAVASSGYFDVSWDNGIMVSPVGTVHRLPDSLSWHRRSSGPGTRAKTPSSVTFVRKGQGVRPATSDAAPRMLSRSADFAAQPARPGTDTGGSRFSRIGRPWPAFTHHDGAGQACHAAIPSANLQAPREHSNSYTAAAARAQTAPNPTTSTADQAPVVVPAAPAAALAPTAAQAVSQPAASSDAPPALSAPGPAPRHAARAAAQHRLGTPTVQNMQLQSSTAGPSGLPGVSKASRQQTRASSMSNYKPTRAQALIVFNDMDKAHRGKITLSELEEACVGLGFSLRQAHSLFDRLDQGHKGFLTDMDWGTKEAYRVVEMFTLMYMRRFMGLPDISATEEEVKRYFRAQEIRKVKSLPAAINLVRVNAVTRGVRAASVSGDPVYDAFRFIDTDNSGRLSKDELKDGFAALGVNLTEQVVDQIMRVFDRDQNGTVEYHEFVKIMFPKSIR